MTLRARTGLNRLYKKQFFTNLSSIVKVLLKERSYCGFSFTVYILHCLSTCLWHVLLTDFFLHLLSFYITGKHYIYIYTCFPVVCILYKAFLNLTVSLKSGFLRIHSFWFNHICSFSCFSSLYPGGVFSNPSLGSYNLVLQIQPVENVPLHPSYG